VHAARQRGWWRRAAPPPTSATACARAGVGAVGLGHHHGGARHAQQRQHRQVLARLRHDAVVGGHQQQRVVDAAGAGEHGVHEPLVAGDVDEADARTFGRIEEGIAQLDADAALLLLGQAVGVHARERLHERRLAVVDVAGGADDHARRSRSTGSCATKAWRVRPGLQGAQVEPEAASAMRPTTGRGSARSVAASSSSAAAAALARRHGHREARGGQRLHRQRARADLPLHRRHLHA
jgi:hypothetical protein